MPTSFGWRLRNSWWVLLVVLGLGCLSGTGFLYIGITARRPAWWGIGVAYLVLPWSALVAINRLGEDSQLSTALAVAYFALWFAGIVHALILNGSWLRWRAANRPWFEAPQPQAQPGPLAPPPVFAAPPAPAAAPAFAAPPAAAPAFSAPPVAAPALDVNAATAAQLAQAAGLDLGRAERVVADREARGGFRTVEEFATAAALAPHEFARIRAGLTCTPRPQAPHQQGPGRVLDF
ncbi:helix-hairpin-helix domain-containing protein [Dactylosporangium sp. CA-052675]|uniref:helix-hairpin-helix domain-containing protein n=1 Tax=Dactylosporangium sp. CA-052675 TaxID=3239927 RepID=UPI003D920883